MTTTTAIENETGAARRFAPRIVREHLFLSLALVCVLIGSGFRFAAGTSAAAPSGPAATACAAK